MSLGEAFAPAEARYRAQVIGATWGHLRAKPRKRHRARIIFACAGYGGNIVIITARVRGVSDSPWLYDHMMDFARRKAKQGLVHVFEGHYYALKNGGGRFIGKVSRLATSGGA
jgi:hypothetical protein